MMQRRNKGFTLLEIIIAVSIFALVMATVVVVFSRTMDIYQRTVDKAESSQKAANAFEWLTRDIQSSPCLYEGDATSIALQPEGAGYTRYYLDVDGTTLMRSSGCGATAQNYTVAEDIANLEIEYYNATNQIVTAPQNDPAAVKAVELNITTAKRNQRFSLNSVARFNYSPACPWARAYGGSAEDDMRFIQETSDKGYLLTGRTKSFGAGGYDAFAVKTDSQGNFRWAKTYGGAKTELIWSSLQQTSDGAYILGGVTYSFAIDNSDFFLIRTDSQGALTWAKTYGGSGDEQAQSIIQTSDGGYILAGWSNAGSFGLSNYDMFLVKTASNGVLQWARTYGGAMDEKGGLSVQQTFGGGYIIGGETLSFGAGEEDFFLIKTDSQGALTWAKTYGNAQKNMMRSLEQTPDGGYILFGYSRGFGTGSADVLLIKTDSNGNVGATFPGTWAKSYGTNLWDDGWSVHQTPDGGYIIGGTTIFYGGDDMLLIKTDSSGNVGAAFPGTWAKIYRGETTDELAWSLQQTTDGGYILGRWRRSAGDATADFFVVKTDSQGNIANCCVPDFVVREFPDSDGDPDNDFSLAVREYPDLDPGILEFPTPLVVQEDNAGVPQPPDDFTVTEQTSPGDFTVTEQTSPGDFTVTEQTSPSQFTVTETSVCPQ